MTGHAEQRGEPVSPVTSRPSRSRIATAQLLCAVVALLAGGLAIGAAFLPWMTVTALGSTTTLIGFDATEGWLVIMIGLILAGYGAVNLTGRDRQLAPSILTGLLALVGVGVGVQQLRNVARSQPMLQNTLDSIDPESIFLGLEGSTVDTSVQVTAGPGLWLVVAAGVLGAIAAALNLLLRRRASRSDA